VELPVLIALAAAAALVTLLVCDLAGGIARAKGRSYWLFFALGLLLWFPALIAALALPARSQVPAAHGPGRLETAAAGLLLLLAVLAVAAAATAVVSYAP
jgi:hypothetical protein